MLTTAVAVVGLVMAGEVTVTPSAPFMSNPEPITSPDVVMVRARFVEPRGALAGRSVIVPGRAVTVNRPVATTASLFGLITVTFVAAAVAPAAMDTLAVNWDELFQTTEFVVKFALGVLLLVPNRTVGVAAKLRPLITTLTLVAPWPILAGVIKVTAGGVRV
jgi:hypothetical protein